MTACSPAIPQGEDSILIIAIPGFRADALGCGSSSDSLTPQLDLICAESVRFTHAYTTSTLVNPALASIFTGLYPLEHGIHRNDASRYAEGIKSVAAIAHERGFQSIFVSGGVPALRKAAISKGFDDFDDSIRSSGGTEGGYYRTANDTVSSFFSLLDAHSEGISFLGTLFFADLMFPEVTSLKTSQNDRREGSYNGKLQEIDEAIGNLKSNFKKLKIWDQLTVFVIGLQGLEKSEHEGLSRGISLYDEIVKIPLLVKPSHKPRDQNPSWKIDEPISLADIGVTLFRLLDEKNLKKSGYPTRDLIGAMEGQEFPHFERPLFCETDLPAWRNWGPSMVSIRVGKWVYWNANEPKLFNTYSDRLELHNLYSKDYTAFVPLNRMLQTYKHFDSSLTPGFQPVSVGEKLKVARNLFSKSAKDSDKIKELADLSIRKPDDWQVMQWRVQFLVETQNWFALKDFLKNCNPKTTEERSEYALWQGFLNLSLHTKEEMITANTSLNCIALAIAMKKSSIDELAHFVDQQICRDSETQYWLKAFINFKSKRLREASNFFDLARAASDKRMEQMEFAKLFWIDGAQWDYKDNLPAGPSVFELFSALVTNKEFLEFIKKKQLT